MKDKTYRTRTCACTVYVCTECHLFLSTWVIECAYTCSHCHHCYCMLKHKYDRLCRPTKVLQVVSHAVQLIYFSSIHKLCVRVSPVYDTQTLHGYPWCPTCPTQKYLVYHTCSYLEHCYSQTCVPYAHHNSSNRRKQHWGVVFVQG